MSERTGCKYRGLGKLPSEACATHSWRTRSDPFAAVWPEVQALPEQDSGRCSRSCSAATQDNCSVLTVQNPRNFGV